MTINFQQVLEEIVAETASLEKEGNVANYIPELAKVSPDHFGISLHLLNGKHYRTGDSEMRFSIQSIAKVFSLSMAIGLLGESIFQRVDVEPSGTAFNSLLQLDYEEGIPRNPFINAGALVVVDILLSELKDPQKELLQYVRKLAGNQEINFNDYVAASEKVEGYRNIAMANLLKSHGNLHNKVEDVLDFYFRLCSIEMSCSELSKTFLVYAHHGRIPHTREKILTKSQAKRLNALMQTCGFYDEAGEFSYKVGLPGKSGVGGGIVAVLPEKFSLSVWSPALNKKGNSVRGMKALELFTTKTGLSVF
nr:glutaminase [Candidatus Sulfidibacterium hydrothermale]